MHKYNHVVFRIVHSIWLACSFVPSQRHSFQNFIFVRPKKEKMASRSERIINRPWQPPDDDWDSADGGVSGSQRKERSQRKQKQQQQGSLNSSPRTLAREAVKWITMSDDGDNAPVKAWPEDVDFASPVTLPSSRLKDTPDTAGSTPNSGTIPANYLRTIEEAFGPSADLYDDVLKVSWHSSPRDIRIAYFRRGREVLSEGDYLKSAEAVSIGGSVSNVSKQRFQAVSMAYEILGNSAWKEAYDARGTGEPDEDYLVKAVGTSATSSPDIRRSSSLGPRRTGTRNAVRWSEEVEELMFDQHPTEVVRRSRKNRKKKEVVVETGELQRHLEQLDKEAEKHFVVDFLDDIEASIEELISLGSFRDRSSSKSLTGKVDEIKTNTTTKTEEAAEKALPAKKLSYDFEMPPELAMPRTEPATQATDETVDTNTDDTVSTMSASIVELRTAKSTKIQLKPLERVSEEETSFRSGDGRSGDGTITPTPTVDILQEHAETSIVADVCDAACDPDVWCGSDEDAYPKDEQDNIAERVVPLFPSEDVVENDEEMSEDDDTPEFHFFLINYLQTLAADLYEWGASFQDVELETTATQAMQAMMITENDLEGMLSILRTEIR